MAKITVSTMRPSFRRAGITFTRSEPTVLDTEKLAKRQIEAIRAEPMLSVRAVPAGAKKAPTTDGKKSD
jgi:hypothetical protein